MRTSHFTSFNQSHRLYWGLWGMFLRRKTLSVRSGVAVKKLKHLLDSKIFLKGLWCMPNNILEPLSDCACRCWRTAPESLILPPFSSKKVRKINGFHPILKLQKVKNMDFGEKSFLFYDAWGDQFWVYNHQKWDLKALGGAFEASKHIGTIFSSKTWNFWEFLSKVHISSLSTSLVGCTGVCEVCFWGEKHYWFSQGALSKN